MELNFIHLVFTLQLEKDVGEQAALLGLRQDFEQALSRSAGCSADSNGRCARPGGCTFHNAFSQQLSPDRGALKRFQKPSLPFVIQAPLLPSLPNKGSVFEVGLVLVGPAAISPGDYISAFNGMLEDNAFRQRVTLSMVKVESVGYVGNRSVIGYGANGIAVDRLNSLSLKGMQETAAFSPDIVTLSIVTPMRLFADGRPLKKFSFSPFIRALFRRVSSMAYYYGEVEEGLDYKWLAEQSHAIECTASDCRWLEMGTKFSGLIGTVTCTGNLMEYHPFLVAGEYLNVGKGGSFGLGRFIIDKSHDCCKGALKR